MIKKIKTIFVGIILLFGISTQAQEEVASVAQQQAALSAVQSLLQFVKEAEVNNVDEAKALVVESGLIEDMRENGVSGSLFLETLFKIGNIVSAEEKLKLEKSLKTIDTEDSPEEALNIMMASIGVGPQGNALFNSLSDGQFMTVWWGAVILWGVLFAVTG